MIVIAHEVTPYSTKLIQNSEGHTAERYNLVFFVNRHTGTINDITRGRMPMCGIVMPNLENMKTINRLMGPPADPAKEPPTVCASIYVQPNRILYSNKIIVASGQVVWDAHPGFAGRDQGRSIHNTHEQE